MYSGGRGGLVSARIPTTPGEVLHVTPGARGGWFGLGGWIEEFPSEGPFSFQLPGGSNGGGHSGVMERNVWIAGGGGGASDVRRSPFGLTGRILVAGGGGGGASRFQGGVTIDDALGGSGGGATGSMGLGNGQGGRGGTQSWPGGGGPNGGGGHPGKPGSLDTGGEGGYANAFAAAGGGGGGGWNGGGGGGSGALTGGGGGGGSSKIPAGALAGGAFVKVGAHRGPGRITASFDVPSPGLTVPTESDVTTIMRAPGGAIVRFPFLVTDVDGVASSYGP
jgi:hypothetical protein